MPAGSLRQQRGKAHGSRYNRPLRFFAGAVRQVRLGLAAGGRTEHREAAMSASRNDLVAIIPPNVYLAVSLTLGITGPEIRSSLQTRLFSAPIIHHYANVDYTRLLL